MYIAVDNLVQAIDLIGLLWIKYILFRSWITLQILWLPVFHTLSITNITEVAHQHFEVRTPVSMPVPRCLHAVTVLSLPYPQFPLSAGYPTHKEFSCCSGGRRGSNWSVTDSQLLGKLYSHVFVTHMICRFVISLLRDAFQIILILTTKLLLAFFNKEKSIIKYQNI